MATLSRRNFLKAAGATGVAGALGSALGTGSISAFASAPQAQSDKKEYKGFCMMCKQTGCANIVTMENGVVPDVRCNPAHICSQGK